MGTMETRNGPAAKWPISPGKPGPTEENQT